MPKKFTYTALRILFFSFHFLFFDYASAQVKSKTLSAPSDTLFIDSVPFALASIHVFHHDRELRIGSDYFTVKNFTAIVLSNANNYDSLRVVYQSYPDWLLATRKHREADITNTGIAKPVTGSNAANEIQADEETVNTDGTLLRGLSFGNAQDLVLNSSLNLRMHGNVGKGMVVEGAVTDQEFPFQPEGTTTTLQDFDRIYVALHMPKASVLLGDYPFQSAPEARFMKYAKKNRGLQLKGLDTFGKTAIRWETGAALARGRFSRNEINGVEGLQGPYRLKGSRGEQFVIVVSGTEVVYLDGQKMERGLQSDYVIDYNTGEITFTPKHIINAFSRIVVEFQYSDRFYTRSVVGGNVSLQRNKVTLYTGIYSEQDARNQPIQQDLEVVDSATGLSAREILRDAGDDPSMALFPGARKLTQFSNSELNYVLRDTGSVQFYEYVEAPDTFTTFYRVSFSYVGPGNGEYIITGSTANGKVYRYVGFISGIPAGDYSPVTQIQAPNRLSLAEVGLTIKPRTETTISANFSASANDKNLFSPTGDNDNAGIAGYFNISDKHYLRKSDSAKKWYVQNRLQLEQTSKNYVSIERYRDVEFGREWNRSLYNPENGLDPSGSGFATAQTELGYKNAFAIYAAAGANKAKNLEAKNAKIGLRTSYKTYFVEPRMEWSHSTLGGTMNEFQKQYVDFGFRKSKSTLVLTAHQEQSLYTNLLMQELPQNYGLRILNAAFNKQFNQWNLNISAQDRRSQNLKSFVLADAADARTASVELSGKNRKNSWLKMAVTARQMELLDTFFKNLYATEEHFAGRLEYNFSKWLNVLSGNIYYQTISGREQQRQYTYFEVPAGQGFYTWVDFNGNGVKESNEFQETPFKDQAKYIRLLVPTGSYIKAQSTEFSGNLLYQPSLKFKKRSLGKLQNRVTWNYTGKSADSVLYQRILPFIDDGGDAQVLSFNAFVRNLLEYETNDGKWMLQYNVQSRANKLYFTNGFDRRGTLGQQIFSRLNIGSIWQIRLGLESRKSEYNSEYVPANNFQYTMKGAEPAFTFQPNSRLRLGMSGKWSHYFHGAEDIASLYEAVLQTSRTIRKTGMLELKLSVLEAQYLLAKGTTLAYDVLQGFSSGRNYRAMVDFRFSISKNIQMVMNYEGRKTADVQFVHIGRVEARYLF